MNENTELVSDKNKEYTKHNNNRATIILCSILLYVAIATYIVIKYLPIMALNKNKFYVMFAFLLINMVACFKLIFCYGNYKKTIHTPYYVALITYFIIYTLSYLGICFFGAFLSISTYFIFNSIVFLVYIIMVNITISFSKSNFK